MKPYKGDIPLTEAARADYCDCCGIEIEEVISARANWHQCPHCERECPFYVPCNRMEVPKR